MGSFTIKINDSELSTLAEKLRSMNEIRFNEVIKKNVVQMLNTARRGGTPISTDNTRPGGPHGELRKSSSTFGDEMGYSKEYAPHVEYGHRTRNGGWVPGQHFLQANVETQRPIYYLDLLNAIKKG